MLVEQIGIVVKDTNSQLHIRYWSLPETEYTTTEFEENELINKLINIARENGTYYDFSMSKN